MPREMARFRAAGDDGQPYTIVLTSHALSPHETDGETAETRGRDELRTDTGDLVSRLDKGRYQVISTGVLLTSDDPAAP